MTTAKLVMKPIDPMDSSRSFNTAGVKTTFASMTSSAMATVELLSAVILSLSVKLIVAVTKGRIVLCLRLYRPALLVCKEVLFQSRLKNEKNDVV